MKIAFSLVDVLLILALFDEAPWVVRGDSYCRQTAQVSRPHSVSITEFGAVDDGITLNTKAFRNAIFYLNSFADKGGAELFVPAGQWLTGSFDLISHLTLSLDKDAVILGSTNSADWPIIDPLPSYGRGRELPGPRHRSLIFGKNLVDVIITGDNGTINGQGNVWWDWFRNGTLNYTRPHLVEFINSTDVIISNLTFLDSPFWNIHPVYCSKVTIQNVTIIAPPDSPNTDGIDPDSSNDVCIEDCYISIGDDLISIKSGWDEYGISYGRPSTNIIIHRLTGQTGSSSGIALGSEMSGGISEVYAKHIQIFNSNTGIRVKTSPGRGGYVKNIYISDVTMTNVKTAIKFTSNYGEHPDDHYDPFALPVIEKITIKDVYGENIKVAGSLQGIKGDNFVDICLSNITLGVLSDSPWNCSYVRGYSEAICPEICEALQGDIFRGQQSCYY